MCLIPVQEARESRRVFRYDAPRDKSRPLLPSLRFDAAEQDGSQPSPLVGRIDIQVADVKITLVPKSQPICLADLIDAIKEPPDRERADPALGLLQPVNSALHIQHWLEPWSGCWVAPEAELVMTLLQLVPQLVQRVGPERPVTDVVVLSFHNSDFMLPV